MKLQTSIYWVNFPHKFFIRFPQRAANTVEFIVEVLSKSSATSQSIPQYPTLRDESLKALGEILKTQVLFPANFKLEKDKDLRLVNSVFTTLYTPFYFAHTKYLKQVEEAKSVFYSNM